MIFTIPQVTSTILNQISIAIQDRKIDTSQVEVFENIACKIAMIQNTSFPKLLNPIHFIIASDHDVKKVFDLEDNNKELNSILDGSSIIHSFNINKLIDIKIVNAGLKITPENNTRLINCQIKPGTGNYCETKAMDFLDYEKGIENGSKLSLQAFNEGSNCISFGVTSNESPFSASILTSEITNTSIEECIQFNTEIQKDKKEHILDKIKEAKALHSPMTLADIMCTYGGFDMVTIVGGMLKAAELKMTIFVDSFVSATALLFAYQLNEHIIDYCVFSNQSNHRGHRRIIDFFEKKTILHLDFESNLGLGVPIAIPIIEASLAWLNPSEK